jgi:peptide/nickel transport system permease protein
MLKNLANSLHEILIRFWRFSLVTGMSSKIVKKLKNPFLIFLFKKLLVLIGVFIFSMTLIFFVPRLIPGDPVDMIIAKVLAQAGGSSMGGGSSGGSTGSSQGSMASILRQAYTLKFGLDKPIEVQFALFWQRIFTFDFGPSYAYYPAKVSDIILAALPWTLALVVPIPIIGFLLGNRLGSTVSLKSNKFYSALYYAALYLSTFPYYWFAIVLIYVFASVLHWFPISGAYSLTWLAPAWNIDFIIDAAYHYALPFISLASQGIGGWAIGMRAVMASQQKSTYVEYSKQLGLSSKKIRKYMERNAILPNFTWLPMALAGLIGQTLLVEVVFNYPGLGQRMYYSAFSLDYPMLEASFLIVTLIVLVGNFICDMIYGILNPALGASYISEGAK